jgi:hypothetical protein
LIVSLITWYRFFPHCFFGISFFLSLDGLFSLFQSPSWLCRTDDKCRLGRPANLQGGNL